MSTSMAQQADQSILEEAKNLLVQGKRFMALEDFQSATDSLEQCCQLFDAFYGVAKRECADAYLEYGLALVALANLEAGTGTEKIMKKAGIEGDEENEEDDYDEDNEDEDNDDEEEADEANNGSEKNEEAKQDKTEEADVPMEQEEEQITKEPSHNGVHQENGKTNGTTTKESTPEEAQSSSSHQEDPTPGTSSGKLALGSGGDDDEAVENEEATTIEIAWEVLCLAKRLFMTDESMEGRLKLAETLQKIGEISIEWDNNDNAVSILEECLKIRKAILPAEDRLIALTYYHLGLAHSFKSDTQSANENFQNAISVIEKRIVTLSDDLEKAKQSQDTIAISTYQKEINELKELLPDMTMRLDDSKDDSATSSEVLKRTREEMQLEDEEVKKVCLDKSKPVDDISHLVKRKAT